MMRGVAVQKETTTGLCAACGIPVDSQYFDDSTVQRVPAIDEELILARFELPAQYCGVLQYFSQFTDAFGADNSKIATPGIEWKILINGHALFPYISLRQIVNPWGFGSFPVNIRLDENSTIEMVARGLNESSLSGGGAGVIKFIGGRIVGRFWYNASYGDVRHQRH